jgi:FtsP/CotA-like multicopper oxidase with cupredoxin domain
VDERDYYGHRVRRGLVLLGGAVSALLLAAAMLWPRTAPTAIAAVGAAPASAASGAPALREFTLTAQEVDWELFPGTTVKAWAYNGVMPGPELRVTEGDTVRVTLVNQLPVPTTIHWHGVDVPPDMDGVPGISQQAVPPGGTFVYEFTATNPGTRWYHTHQDPEVQTHLGLYGALIIEPRTTPAGQVTYNRDYTYILSEWSLALTPDVATGEAVLPQAGHGAPFSKQLDFDLFLMNGKVLDAISPITVKQGERIRVRLINAGSLVHTIHSHGHSFKIVSTDGNPVPPAAQLTKDSVTLGPSERVDIELEARNPGVWMFHCHMEHHMANGMMTTIQYEGAQPAVAAHDHSAPPPAAVGGVATSGMSGAAQVTAGSVTTPYKVTMTDNRYTPASLTVPVGSTVAWINNGTNLHTTSAFDVSFDSGAVANGMAWTFTFTKPGTYQYFCRQHFLNGMSGVVVVQ